ncbi:MAG TPA: hypothetical protein VGV93_01685 [Acidimicrobiales bacterium]|nr:hypothetical protein [Acidimicrobiales bacterium]
MVLSGGVGVVAVVVFVTAMAFGTDIAEVAPGARLGIASDEGPIGLAVLVPRCRGERVVSVELLDADGTPLWRVASAKGAIDDRYVVGAEETPFATTTEIELHTPLPPGPLTAVASLDDESFDATDRVTFDPSAVPADGVLYQGAAIGTSEFRAQAAGAADCGGPTDDLGFVTWVFVAAGLGVVVTYLMMVMRYLRGRTPSR